MIPTGKIRRFLQRKVSRYEPLVYVEIAKQHIRHNYEAAKQKSALRVAPVLKSNAYGHGLIEVASIMQETDAPFLIVDSLFEAISIRKHGIKTPLLTIGYVSPENSNNIRLKDISFTATSLRHLEELANTRRRLKLHLKIDTGMSRQGINMDQITRAMQILKNNPQIKLEGVCSHFAQGELPGSQRTQTQIKRWNAAVEQIEKELGTVERKHIGATTGVQYTQKINVNMMRLGIGLYGVDPAGHMLDLKEALHMTAPIVSVKDIIKGEWIGYGEAARAKEDMRIGILPLGYYEGMQRDRSNRGAVYWGDTRLPIVGRISMNLTTVDISKAPQIKVGERISCIGGPQEEMSIQNIAEQTEKIPYEIMTAIPQHLRRIIV